VRRGPLARAALICALLFSCAQPSVVREGKTLPYESAAQNDLDTARKLLAKGDPTRAEQVLIRFQSELGKSKHADEALYLMGEVQLAKKDPPRAASTWRRLVETYPKSQFNVPAAMRAATLYGELDRPEDGRRLLERANASSADAPQRAKLYRLQADLARASGDWPAAVVALAYTRRDTTDPASLAELDLEIGELVDDRLREPELEALIARLPRGPVYDRVNLALASRALARNDVAKARSALDRLPRQLSPAEDAERARLLARASDRAGDDEATLGLVLPLSGPFEKIGESILRGFVLESGVYAEPPSRLRLLVRDSAGDPERAAAATRELLAAGVVAIVGPVRSSEAVAAAPLAEAEQVPLLSFARRDDVAELGEYVFRIGLTPGDQAGALARFCAEQRACKRFAILYPEDEYGTSFKNSFWDAVEANGGSVVAIESYTPGTVDWQTEIKQLVGLEPLSPGQSALVKERDKLRRNAVQNAAKLAAPELQGLPPYVDFDAIFIPDDAASVGLILPQLRFFDVRDVVYLGGSGWNDPALVKIAAREATRAVFTDEFFAGSARPEVVEFVRSYAATYGVSPDAYAAEGRDAATVLRAAIAEVGGSDGDALHDRLLALPPISGVTGLESFDPKGGARKSLEFLTVRGDAITAITPTTPPPP
jgi:ABC-type branched-subunit amino acid transport system substrate-binding protein